MARMAVARREGHIAKSMLRPFASAPLARSVTSTAAVTVTAATTLQRGDGGGSIVQLRAQCRHLLSQLSLAATGCYTAPPPPPAPPPASEKALFSRLVGQTVSFPSLTAAERRSFGNTPHSIIALAWCDQGAPAGRRGTAQSRGCQLRSFKL